MHCACTLPDAEMALANVAEDHCVKFRSIAAEDHRTVWRFNAAEDHRTVWRFNAADDR